MKPMIKNGKLGISLNGNFQGLGVRFIRRQIATIEASKRELKASTVEVLSVYREAVHIWNMRAV